MKLAGLIFAITLRAQIAPVSDLEALGATIARAVEAKDWQRVIDLEPFEPV